MRLNFSCELDKKTNTVYDRYGLYIIEAKLNSEPNKIGIANGSNVLILLL